jgi:hypothetical protein
MVIDNTSDIYPSKYICAADLRGRRVPVTIREVSFEMLKDRKGVELKKPILYFKKAKKGWVVNKTNLKILQTISKNYHDWIGKTIELYSVPTMMGEGIVAAVSGANGNGTVNKVEAQSGIDPDDDVPPDDNWEDQPESADDNVPDEKLPF